MKVLQPPEWRRPPGYSNGIAAQGQTIFVAGQIGWDASGRIATGLTAQVEQALSNILAVLAEAGAGPQHVTRLTWFVTDIDQYCEQAKAIGPGYRRIMGKHFPTMSVIGVNALVEPDALVEIEATAVLPTG
jgi:enamine deaminase RidA (YjgF/YER057c/UK114 family)